MVVSKASPNKKDPIKVIPNNIQTEILQDEGWNIFLIFHTIKHFTEKIPADFPHNFIFS